MKKRQLSKVKGRYYNNLRLLSHPSSEFIKCPVNISDALRDSASRKIKKGSDEKAWKDFRLYVRYLDLKVQNPDVGIFKIFHSKRYYQRTVSQLIEKGWAIRKNKEVHLRAYQHVWKDMGVNRVDDRGVLKFKYWKIPVDAFSNERRIYEKGKKIVGGYLKEIEHEIRKRISKRKLAQIRYALKEKGNGLTRAYQATFSAKSASITFGYTSDFSGSKLRQKYFSIIPMTPEEAKPRFNIKEGRYKDPVKSIAL